MIVYALPSSADEVEVELKNLAKQVSLVRKVFAEQQEAVVAVTEGERGVRAVTRYLHAAQQEDTLNVRLDFDRWAESFQSKLEKVLLHGYGGGERLSRPRIPAEQRLSNKLRRAWKAIKVKVNPLPVPAN